MIIIHCTGNDGLYYYYGPFTSGVQATNWGFKNLQGYDWHWNELISPEVMPVEVPFDPTE
jgi:hypothetical protein